VAGGARHDGDRHRGGGAPAPVTFRPSVRYSKDEVVEICGALAMAEVVLARLGRPIEAGRLAAVFDLVEGRLAG